MAGLLIWKKKYLEAREGCFWRGRGRSFHVEGPKMKQMQELTVENLVQEIWRPKVLEIELRAWEGM